jgi:hypothetical protein
MRPLRYRTLSYTAWFFCTFVEAVSNELLGNESRGPREESSSSVSRISSFACTSRRCSPVYSQAPHSIRRLGRRECKGPVVQEGNLLNSSVSLSSNSKHSQRDDCAGWTWDGSGEEWKLCVPAGMVEARAVETKRLAMRRKTFMLTLGGIHLLLAGRRASRESGIGREYLQSKRVERNATVGLLILLSTLELVSCGPL